MCIIAFSLIIKPKLYLLLIVSQVFMQENQTYLPREDSFLLAKAVKEYAYGKTLDMCTGSGFLAKAAADSNKVTSVIGVDINPDALAYAKKENNHLKIKYLESNLFSNIKGTFDTVICNPPYLPDHPLLKDIALDGGEKGYEIPVKFLKDAKKHLKKDGQILFLFSSLTNKEVIDQTLIENAYTFEKIDEEKFEDGEILYVYKIKNVESVVKRATNIKFFSKGKRGLIYTAKYSNKKVAIKIKNPKSTAISRMFIEGENLKKVNELGIGPKLINYSDDFVMYTFVEGLMFEEFLGCSTKKDTLNILESLFNQMRTLDMAKISKQEMTNPYKHILVTKNVEPVLIDFERSSNTPNPNNINQFLQYLFTDRITSKLMTKKIMINKEKLIELSKEYKKDYSEKIYKQILACVK